MFEEAVVNKTRMAIVRGVTLRATDIERVVIPQVGAGAWPLGWAQHEGCRTGDGLGAHRGSCHPPPSLPGPPPGTGVELELGCALLNGACSIPDTVPGIVHQMVTTCVTGAVGAF